MSLYLPKYDQVSTFSTDTIKIRGNEKLLTKGICCSALNKAWKKGLTGKGIIVSVVDTGIGNHTDLKDKVIKSFNLTDQPITDSHGTHVAGTIAANGWLIGGAPDAKLLDIKVINSGGGSIDNIIKAIGLSVTNGATVINMSLGGQGLNQPEINKLTAAVQNAWSNGCICIAASGNDGTSVYSVDQYEYPASIEKVESIAACSVSQDLQTIKLAVFSNENNRVDMAACGVEVFSTILNNKYATYSGTSMATPHVSALAALLAEFIKTNYPTLTGSSFSANLVSLLRQNIVKIKNNTALAPTLGYNSALSGMINVTYTDISFGLGFARYQPEEDVKPPQNNRLFYSDRVFVGFLLNDLF